MGGYVLTLTIVAPLLASLVLLVIPARRALLIRVVAAVGAGITLPAALWLCATYDRQVGGFQFRHTVPWVPSLGMAFHVAADGTSLALILLTAFIITTGVFASWTQQNRTKEFLSLLLLLVSGVFGVFAARDLFFLFLFYEIAVLPMYLLIGLWGTSTRERTKEHSAMKLTLMLLGGSALILVAILALYLTQTTRTFDLDRLAAVRRTPQFEQWVFLLVYVGFGVLAGIWPFHTWSPDGHASAPTAVSMLHAGVLMKLGAYGVLRLGVELLPEGAQHWAFLIGCVATINILYGAMSAMAQTDLKYVIAYSSVSHMGVVMLGLAAMNRVGLNGSVMQMVSHGIMTGLFFAAVGLIYEKAHTRDTLRMGGFARRMPGIAVMMTIGGLASFGLPGTSGFVAEFLAFYGMWLRYPVLALLSVCGIVITAVYVLRLIQRVFLGRFDDVAHAGLGDARTTEWAAIVTLGALLLALGLWPKPLVRLIDAGVRGKSGTEAALRGSAEPRPPAEADQASIWALSQYLPNSTFVAPINRLDDYTFRSVFPRSLCIGWIADDAEFPTKRAARMLLPCRALRHLLVGSCCPLTGYSRSTRDWMAMQFHRSDLDARMIVVYRRKDSPYRTSEVTLRGVKPSTMYALRSETTGEVTRVSGASLQQMVISLMEPHMSDILVYSRAKP